MVRKATVACVSKRRRYRHAPRLLVVTLATLLLGFALVAAPTYSSAQPHPAGASTGFTAQVPHAPSSAVRLGALPNNATLHVDVVLQPRNAAALKEVALEASTPGSAGYRRYLRPGEFALKFGASSHTVVAVLSALRQAGLKPGKLSANGLSVPVTGTAANIGHAFSTRFLQYRLQSGRIAYANATVPVLEHSIDTDVQAILGLDNLHQEQAQRSIVASPRRSATPQAAHLHPLTTGPQPCSNAQSAGSETGAFTADQFAEMYSVDGIYRTGDLGRGQTVGLYELEPDSAADIAAYQSCFGTSTKVSYVNVDGGPGTGAGEGEAALDIETVIGLAPAVNIIVYGGPNTNDGAYDTYSSIVSDDAAQVISVSWAECETDAGSSLMEAENTLFEQAAVQGQSFVAASGDTGSESCYRSNSSDTSLSVNDPASQPFVTAVGGTTIVNPAVPPSEVVWNESGQGASGGGESSQWAEPGYQQSFIGTTTDREIPDISADADPDTGYVVYYNGEWTAIGGTSAATPLWAALFALTNAECSSDIGFANPLLYQSFSLVDPISVGYDITANPDSATPNDNDYTGTNDGEYPAMVGYDMATGLGTPEADTLARQLCANGGAGPDTVPGDFSGAGHSDVSVFRPSTGTWYINGSASIKWGLRGDIPVAAAYGQAGPSTVAVFRPSSATWYIRGLPTLHYGLTGDIPVPGTYDGPMDLAVFRPSSGNWYVRGGQTVHWGTSGDIPVVGDFDGDGRADVAVFRPSNGTWYVNGHAGVQWGQRGDIPVAGDFNGDGHTDLTVFRPSNGTWYVRGQRTVSYGKSGDLPAENN